MVLKNSKYDKQAKKKYMSKHGLLPKRDPNFKPMRPKWSSKQKTENKEYLKLDIDEMTSDWDSDVDEDIVNFFYPQIGDELIEMPMEQKRRVKLQIIEDLKIQRDDLFNQASAEPEQEVDGIYLGNQEETPHSQVKLSEFLPQIPITKRKNRKLPINDDSQDLLDEYGIENYKELIRNKNDYEDVHKKHAARDVDNFSAQDLIGFEVGKDSLADIAANNKEQKPKVRQLTEEELQQEKQRKAASEQAKFYSDIKEKFKTKPQGTKVLELNNYDKTNEDHVSYINQKIVAGSTEEELTSMDDDLDALLGTKFSKLDVKSSSEQASNIDDFLSSLDAKKEEGTKNPILKKQSAPSAPQDQDFLDDLLN